MKYAYFPGCSLQSTAREYDMSTREVAGALGIELVEIPDWICCGATPAHITMHLLSIALPVKNIIKAKEMDSFEIATCCAACFSRLKIANHIMETDPDHRDKVNRIVGANYKGDVTVRHFLDILVNRYGLDSIGEKIQHKLEGLKVACYYGCLLTRPQEITELDDQEAPHIMDLLMETIGAESVDWPYKMECCGASLSLTRTDVVLRLCNDILQMARDEGAEAVVVACPMCQSNLDLRQKEINEKYNKEFNMPVLYFTQLLGLALGIEPKRLGLKKHIVSPKKLLREKQLWYV